MTTSRSDGLWGCLQYLPPKSCVFSQRRAIEFGLFKLGRIKRRSKCGNQTEGRVTHPIWTSGYLTLLPLPLILTTATMNSLVQRFDTNSALKEIKRAKAIIEEDGDTVSDLMWGSNGGFGNLASGIPKFNMPAVPDVSSPL